MYLQRHYEDILLLLFLSFASVFMLLFQSSLWLFLETGKAHSINNHRMHVLSFFPRHCTTASLGEQPARWSVRELVLLASHLKDLEHNLPHSDRALNSLYTRTAHRFTMCAIQCLKSPHIGIHIARYRRNFLLKGQTIAFCRDPVRKKHFVVRHGLFSTTRILQHFSAMLSSHHTMLSTYISGYVTIDKT